MGDDDIHVPDRSLSNGHASAFLVERLFSAPQNHSMESTNETPARRLKMQVDAMDASENQLRVGRVVNCLCGACDKYGQFGGRERGGRN